MIVYSKLLPYTCYEVGHTWHPSCTKSSFDMFISAGYMSLQIYAVAYFFTFLASKKKLSKGYIQQLLKHYFQSSLFLAFNGSFFVASFCVLRLIIRRITFLSPGFFPGFLASLLAIYVERVSRRSQLAIYVCNVASECFWNVLKARGYVTPVRYGEVLIFSAAMALFGYFYKSATNLGSFVNSILKFLLGKDESGEKIVLASPALEPFHWKAGFKYSHIYKWRHPKCPHTGSCITNALKAASLAGIKGYAFQMCFKTYTSLYKLPKRPSLLLEILFGRSSFKSAAAFAWFSSVFKLTCCLARRFVDDDRPIHGAFAGGIAGLAMALYPSTTLAIYTSWKALEAVYEKGIEAGYLPVVPHGIEFLYAFSTGYLFHVATLESHNMKPSYWRFLMDLSAGKIGEFNTALLDCYGLDSGRNHLWPSYDKKYLTKEFLNKFYK